MTAEELFINHMYMWFICNMYLLGVVDRVRSADQEISWPGVLILCIASFFWPVVLLLAFFTRARG